jgi:alkanesulfonate monooxygenase SsuD/methylene tetrahydromethanopterin reductase-like flavin-dependent oxidoreductase (luciferase family)
MRQDREFGIFLGFGKDWTYPNIRAIVQEAERLGYYAVWNQDNLTSHYPIPRDIEIFDSWTLLPALAANTKTIRLGPMATPALRRFAPLLAKAVASLDVLSNGRLNVGLGSGDDRFQYEMIGQRFPDTGKERREVLGETIKVMKALWREDFANFKGKHFQLDNAVLSPKPVQKPNPPIYIACNTSRRLMPRLAAQHGNGLAVMWGHDETVAVTIRAFQEEWLSAGRRPEEYAALRSAFITFSNHEDPQRARLHETKITGWPGPESFNQQASPAKVPKGSAPDLIIDGKPATIAGILKERVFGMGFNQLMCSFVVCDDVDIDTGGLPGWPGNYLGGMRIFANEVLPRLAYP